VRLALNPEGAPASVWTRSPTASPFPGPGRRLGKHTLATHPAPRVIGRYVLCDLIASGGMAAVHLGRFIGVQEFSRIVAIKQLHEHFAGDREFVAMLFDEARLLARIRHTNVVAPLDVELSDSGLFIVMEYVHGEPLSRVLRAAKAPIPANIACAVMCQVLSGLHAAHEARGPDGRNLDIVHRDVSPQNILVTEDGSAKIVDFGIAKAGWCAHVTSAGDLKGKRSYMAPEQFRGQRVDRRTDLFSAGVVLWEMLTGRRLFTADAPALIEEKVLQGNVPAPSTLVPDLPPELDAVVARALSPDPEQRFKDAHAMAAAIAGSVRLANLLEVGAWASEHAGEALRLRAARILELESVSLDELTLPLPASSPSHERPLAASIAFARTTGAHARVRPRPRAKHWAWSLLALVALSGVAGAIALVQRSDEARASTPGSLLRSRQLLVLASGNNETRSARVGSNTVAPAPVAHAQAEPARAASPAGQPEPTASAINPARPLRTPPHKPSAEENRTTRVAISEPAVQAAPSAEPAPSEASAAPTPLAAAAPPAPNCNPPHWVDENGFKRFKLECVAPSRRP